MMVFELVIPSGATAKSRDPHLSFILSSRAQPRDLYCAPYNQRCGCPILSLLLGKGGMVDLHGIVYPLTTLHSLVIPTGAVASTAERRDLHFLRECCLCSSVVRS